MDRQTQDGWLCATCRRVFETPKGLGAHNCVTPDEGPVAEAETPSTKELAKMIHRNAVKKGFWDNGANIPYMLAWTHSEVSEAFSAYQRGDNENLKEELGDIATMVFDIAEGLGFDIGAEMVKKHKINVTRSHMHGGKRY
jgi:NTP pyrophosphatase (non-canonical NTP hydrolase)